IIYSESINKYYVGESPDVLLRLNQHNNHHFKMNFTKAANDWIVKLNFECDSRDNAVYLEKFIKRMKSRKFIEKVIRNPGILQDILDKRD
ncbi:unnamed protein product, partial [Ectocarpus sp. 4 AP-2014]